MTIKVDESYIDAIIEQSTELYWEPFPGVTVVAWQLPNGFVIEEMSGCIDPANYQLEIGLEIARERLKSKLWMLEGYLAKNRMAGGSE